MEELTTRVGWEYYGGKHHESLWTKFYQNYILPVKFGIDKRKVHLSSLILNGEANRSEAVEELKLPAYPEQELANDLPFVLKKLRFSDSEFDEIMKAPVKSHTDYASNKWILDRMMKIWLWLKPIKAT